MNSLSLGVCTIFVALAAACNRSQAPAEPTPNPVKTHLQSVPPDSVFDERLRPLAQMLRSFNLKDPVADLDANLAHGDHKFVGINGYTCTAPGLDYSSGPRDEQQFAFTFGLRCLEETGDVIDSQLEILQNIAWDYATSYNQELLRRIRAGTVR